jgi:phospholipid/cholesterol/gamma-HCH transport system permease protein
MNATSVLRPIRSIGRATIGTVESVGRGGYLAAGAVRSLKQVDIWAPRFVEHLAGIGVASIPIALFILMFTGIVMAIQASYTFTGTIPLYFVGALVGKTIILELGPVLGSLALAGRVGASIAAEIGTMRVTEQIDALEALAYDPVAYLVVPRVLAGLIMFPIITVFAMLIGIVAGWLTALVMLDMTTPEFVKGLKLLVRRTVRAHPVYELRLRRQGGGLLLRVPHDRRRRRRGTCHDPRGRAEQHDHPRAGCFLGGDASVTSGMRGGVRRR